MTMQDSAFEPEGEDDEDVIDPEELFAEAQKLVGRFEKMGDGASNAQICRALAGDLAPLVRDIAQLHLVHESMLEELDNQISTSRLRADHAEVLHEVIHGLLSMIGKFKPIEHDPKILDELAALEKTAERARKIVIRAEPEDEDDGEGEDEPEES